MDPRVKPEDDKLLVISRGVGVMSFNPMNYDYEWTAIVALLAASIALFGTFRANKIANKNIALGAELEIIKFREKWLSDLRIRMAELNAILLIDGSSDEYNLNDLAVSASYIFYLLNPEDEDFEALRDVLGSANQNYGLRGDDYQSGLAGNIAKEYTEICNRILKREWERIKADMRKYNA